MDWSKAKTIMIVIFLILNIFLLFTTLYTNSAVSSNSDYTRYAEQYLQSRGIKIDTKIQDVTGKIGTMAYSTRSLDLKRLTEYVFGHEVAQTVIDSSTIIQEGNEKIESTGDELLVSYQLPGGADVFKDPKLFQQKATGFIKEMGYNTRDLVLQSSMDSGSSRSLTFNLKYKKSLLFDLVIRIDLDKDGLLKASLPAWEVKRVNNPVYEVLSIYQILVMEDIPQGAVITDISFGYKQISQYEFYYTPVWRVTLGDGTICFFNAYKGERLY